MHMAYCKQQNQPVAFTQGSARVQRWSTCIDIVLSAMSTNRQFIDLVLALQRSAEALIEQQAVHNNAPSHTHIQAVQAWHIGVYWCVHFQETVAAASDQSAQAPAFAAHHLHQAWSLSWPVMAGLQQDQRHSVPTTCTRPETVIRGYLPALTIIACFIPW